MPAGARSGHMPQMHGMLQMHAAGARSGHRVRRRPAGRPRRPHRQARQQLCLMLQARRGHESRPAGPHAACAAGMRGRCGSMARLHCQTCRQAGQARRPYGRTCSTVAHGNLRHEFYGGGRLAELRSCDVYFQAETDSALCREAVWGWTRPWFVLAGSGRPRPAPRAGMACSDAGRVWGVWPVWCPVPPVERGASGVLPGVAGVVPCSSRPARCRPGLRAPTGRNRLCLHHGRPRCPAAAPVPGMRCRPFPAPCSGSSL